MDQAVKLRTYIVEDNATIRANLIGALEELACVEAVGVAATEDEGKEWLMAHSGQWDLAIVDLFLRQGSGLGVLAACAGIFRPVWRSPPGWRVAICLAGRGCRARVCHGLCAHPAH